jgi:N6-adenosine-specific RNA methylase IME4
MIQPLGENRIDIFARQKRDGWDCIGNGINGKDIRQELEEIIRCA